MKTSHDWKDFLLAAFAGFLAAPIGFLSYYLFSGAGLGEFHQPNCEALLSNTVYGSFNGSHCNIIVGVIVSFVMPFVIMAISAYGLKKLWHTNGARIFLAFLGVAFGVGAAVHLGLLLLGSGLVMLLFMQLPGSGVSAKEALMTIAMFGSLYLLIFVPPLISSGIALIVKKLVRRK